MNKNPPILYISRHTKTFLFLLHGRIIFILSLLFNFKSLFFSALSFKYSGDVFGISVEKLECFLNAFNFYLEKSRKLNFPILFW